MKSCLIEMYIVQLKRLAEMHWYHRIQAEKLIGKLQGCSSFTSLRKILKENKDTNHTRCALGRHINAWDEDLEFLEQVYQEAGKVLLNTLISTKTRPLKELLSRMMSNEAFLLQASALSIIMTINDVNFKAIVNYLESIPPQVNPHYKNNFPNIEDVDYQKCCHLLAVLATNYDEGCAIWSAANGLLQNSLNAFVALNPDSVSCTDEISCIFC